jgi:adenylate kinase family enzyme
MLDPLSDSDIEDDGSDRDSKAIKRHDNITARIVAHEERVFKVCLDELNNNKGFIRYPEAYKTGRVEYMEEELNQLMSEKNKNEENAKNSFEQRLKDTKKKAIEENIKHAEKTGSSLTQTIDDKGNLISVANMNTTEKVLNENDAISSADIRNELFEGENIVIGKTDNGQSQLVSGPFVTKKEE